MGEGQKLSNDIFPLKNIFAFNTSSDRQEEKKFKGHLSISYFMLAPKKQRKLFFFYTFYFLLLRKRGIGARAGNYCVGLSTPSRQLRRERAEENPETLCSPTALGTRADGTTDEGSGKVKHSLFPRQGFGIFDGEKKKCKHLFKVNEAVWNNTQFFFSL